MNGMTKTKNDENERYECNETAAIQKRTAT